MVHSPVKPFLAIEWLRPGEGEETAALRLLRRLPDLYGSRGFDILLLDALYAQKPVLELAREMGCEAVTSLKQNSRDLYQSAVRLFAQRLPDATFTESQDHKTYRVQLWDTEGLPFTIDHPEPVRVVRSEEVLERNRFREGKRVAHSTDHNGCGSLLCRGRISPPPPFARSVIFAGSMRTTAGWILTRPWAFKHGFLHACQHRPQRRNASGQRQPVPNTAWPPLPSSC
jgi:hypothetical protein